MGTSDRDLTAYCGLYCGNCLRYKAKAADLAEELGAEWDRIKFHEYTQVKATSAQELRPFQEFLSLLKAIRTLRWETPCGWGDGDAPRENLKKIRKCDLDGWTIHRGKCYPWV